MASQDSKAETNNTKANEPELEGKKQKFKKKMFLIILNMSNFNTPDLESSLLALERLDRGSPDLWPDTSKLFSFK